jgi:translation initiation factor 3 subunit H
MGSSYTQAALVAHVQANQPQQPVVPPPVTEKIPPSMAKFVDVEAEIPVTTVQLDGLVSIIMWHDVFRVSSFAYCLLSIW